MEGSMRDTCNVSPVAASTGPSYHYHHDAKDTPASASSSFADGSGGAWSQKKKKSSKTSLKNFRVSVACLEDFMQPPPPRPSSADGAASEDPWPAAPRASMEWRSISQQEPEPELELPVFRPREWESWE